MRHLRSRADKHMVNRLLIVTHRCVSNQHWLVLTFERVCTDFQCIALMGVNGVKIKDVIIYAMHCNDVIIHAMHCNVSPALIFIQREQN